MVYLLCIDNIYIVIKCVGYEGREEGIMIEKEGTVNLIIKIK